MTDITREALLELVDGRLSFVLQEYRLACSKNNPYFADYWEKQLVKHEHLRLVVEQASPELFKEER